jgi:hypothetical protein
MKKYGDRYTFAMCISLLAWGILSSMGMAEETTLNGEPTSSFTTLDQAGQQVSLLPQSDEVLEDTIPTDDVAENLQEGETLESSEDF